MNEELRNIYQAYLDAPESDRVQLAQEAFGIVARFCHDQGLSDEDGLNFVLNSIKLFVAADRRVSEAEYKLFLQMTNLQPADFDAQTFFEMVQGGSDPEFIQGMDEIIDSMADDAKLALCTMGLAFLTSDGQLTAAELQVFEKILSR